VNFVTAPAADREVSTRTRVARAVGEDGPVTASALARTLGLTPAAVRRHLDGMLSEDLIAARPSTTAYDDLAVSALRYLAERHGREAVGAFAADRVADLEARYAPQVEDAGPGLEARVEALASALSDDGFAASSRPVGQGTPLAATQLCQGHCPVQHVATEFPELCEAETQAFSRLLGVHVQRLATLAHGEHVCTTHVPTNDSAQQTVTTSGGTS